MLKKGTAAFIGSIYSAHKNCDCGGTYERHPHHAYSRDEDGRHPILFPFCADCGEAAPRLMLQFKIPKGDKRQNHDFVYDKHGNTLKSIEDCISLSARIQLETKNEMFDFDNYKGKHAAGTLGETIDRFINREVLKHFPAKEADPDYLYLRDFIAPYFTDVGVFAACDAHINFFIRDMGLIKQPQRDYAKRIWRKVLEVARPAFQVA